MNHLIPITTLFIGVNALIAVTLSVIASWARSLTGVWHGVTWTDKAAEHETAKVGYWAELAKEYKEEKPDFDMLLRKVRVHGNFVEYVPYALLIIASLEIMGAESWLVWLMAGGLTFGRLCAIYGVFASYGPSNGRALGYTITSFLYLGGGIGCIYYAIKTLFL